MANNNFMKQSLNLLSPICMDINDSVVRPFDAFNKKNAPYVGDQLSPFYVSREKDVSDPFYTTNGDKWTIEDYKLCKNGVPVAGKKLNGTFREFAKYSNYQSLWGGNHYTADGETSSTDWRFQEVRRRKVFATIDGTEREVYEYYINNNFNYETDFFIEDKFSIESNIKVVTSEDFKDGFNRWCYLLIADFRKQFLKVYKIYRPSNYTINITTVGTLYFNLGVDIEIIAPYITSVRLPNGMYAFSLIPTSGTRITKRLNPFNFVVKTWEPFSTLTSFSTGYDTGEALQFYTFPFYFDNAIKSAPKAPKVPAVYYVGKYDDIDGENTSPVFYFGNASISKVDVLESTMQILLNFEFWFQDEKILKNDKDIRKKVAVSYTLYDNYYHQVGAIKRKEGNEDIFIPFNFYKRYDLLERDGIFNGVNMNTVDISEDTIVFNDLPDVATFKFNSKTFYLNINNGYQSGLTSENGCLIAPWYSFINGFNVGLNYIYLHKDDGTDLRLIDSPVPEIKTIYNDRYIIIDSDSVLNAYDIQTGKWFNWCSGYNGGLAVLTFWLGPSVRPTQERLETAAKKANNLLLVAAAENANYEVSGNPFISSIFPSTRLLGIVKTFDKRLPYVIMNPLYAYREVDIYQSFSDKSLVPVYTISHSFTHSFVKPNLIGLVYPESTNTILSLSLSARFIKSYNNHDFVIEDGKGYPLVYSNNYPIFGYRSLSFIEGVSNVFVIQNSNYLIFDNKIMSVVFQGDQLVGSTIVCDITGMDFIGNTSQVAFFFSRIAKKIYTFTGDVILREQRGANVIDYVYRSFFIPADNTILMSCKEYDGKDYVYFFGNDSFLKIEQKRLNNVFFADNQIILVSTDNTVSKYSYFKKEGAERLPIELQTGFFGLGNEQMAELDCWYIRVFDEEMTNGVVSVTQNVLTNIGVKSEKKSILINSTMWDSLSKSYLIRYQPRYQNGVGFQLEINSDFAIYEIVASYRAGSTVLTKPIAQI